MVLSKKVERFEDLEVWQEGMRLVSGVYEALRGSKDYGFKDQIQRAAVSVPSNVAEGYERDSNKEFIRFLSIARGSCAELRTQLYLALKLSLMEADVAKDLIERSRKVSAMLSSLTKTRKERF